MKNLQMSQKKRLRHLWSALEQVPGLSGVTADWKKLLGTEYEQVLGFLRPNGKFASSYPCPCSVDCGCYHGVVEHAPDDIVAVCRCEPRRCKTIPIDKTDTVIYAIDRSALNAAIATALQLVPGNEAVDGLYMTSRIATYSPFGGFRFPVYLTMQIEPDDFQRVVDALLARNDQPFILLAPTQDLYSSKCDELLKKRKSHFLALADTLFLEKPGTFTSQNPVQDIMADFLTGVLPTQKDDTPINFFPTPPDTNWNDVTIRFIDGHTVYIQAKDARGAYNYTQMGMVDKRNGNPTKQWHLLESFAQSYGIIDWEHPDAGSKNQKRRELLTTKLKTFFRIEADPICRLDDRGGWRTQFVISSEA
jgi:hypothetical protein